MSNNIFYDPYNEIRCDRFALEKLVKESEAKDQRIAELEEQLKNATKQVKKEVCDDIEAKQKEQKEFLKIVVPIINDILLQECYKNLTIVIDTLASKNTTNKYNKSKQKKRVK